MSLRYIERVCQIPFKCFLEQSLLEGNACERKPYVFGESSQVIHCCPLSAIPQESQFSELKRRCAGFRNWEKVETWDRDAVVYKWMENKQ